ncbi:hypothetical protein CASFOL_020208 [Castilleja foliolosa]|uniref:Heme-binding protein n=1 Tax=Castilleja foliolosa TaxID=1961234 RepID=A0ABD3D068_9LAMI
MEVNNVVLIIVTLCLLCLFELGYSQGVKGYPAPSICKTRECVPYEIIHSEKEFEIRKYNVTYWVETPLINSKSYKDAYQKGFNLLLNYIQGYNIPKIKLDMTAPFLIDFEIHLDQGSTRYNVNYKIPEKVEFPAPYPSQNLTKVGHPMLDFGAVRRVDGYLNNTIISSEIKELEKHLKGTQWEVKEEYPILSVADYNPPLSRVNEIIIWFGPPCSPCPPY